MAKLKKYASVEALKLDARLARVDQPKGRIFSEFENFLKQLQNLYSKKEKTKIDYGQQPGQ